MQQLLSIKSGLEGPQIRADYDSPCVAVWNKRRLALLSLGVNAFERAWEVSLSSTRDVAFVAERNELIVSGPGRKLQICSLVDGKVIGELGEAHSTRGGYGDLYVDRQSMRLFAQCVHPERTEVLNIASKRRVAQLLGGLGQFVGHPSGHALAAVVQLDIGPVVFCDLSGTRPEVYSTAFAIGRTVPAYAFSPEGDVLCAVCENEEMELVGFSVPAFVELFRQKTTLARASDVAWCSQLLFSKDGRKVYFGSREGNVVEHQIAAPRSWRQLRVKPSVAAMDVTATGALVVATADGELSLWSADLAVPRVRGNSHPLVELAGRRGVEHEDDLEVVMRIRP